MTTNTSSAYRGIWIGRDIDTLDCTITIRYLLGLLTNLDHGKGCFAGNLALAKSMRLKPETVSKYINALIKQGLVFHVRPFNGRKRFLRTVFWKPAHPEVAARPPKPTAASDQNRGQGRKEFLGRPRKSSKAGSDQNATSGCTVLGTETKQNYVPSLTHESFLHWSKTQNLNARIIQEIESNKNPNTYSDTLWALFHRHAGFDPPTERPDHLGVAV